jgi:UDP-N-acetylmuramate--alanine ligase
MMLNSLAAIAVGKEFNIPGPVIASSLQAFPGVHRRTEVCGTVRDVTVINDYGHHPTEIRATLAAVRSGWLTDGAKLHVIFQPHRYSRTKDCFVDFLKCFDDATSVTVTDIYAASELPLDGVSSQLLVEAMLHGSKRYIPELEAAARAVVPDAQPGDVILCLGAGSIGTLPRVLLELL